MGGVWRIYPAIIFQLFVFSWIFAESKSSRAGLVMSVARVEHNLRRGRYAKRIGTAGSVYLASTLEYLTAEILELAGNACHQNKKKRINPRHIMMAIDSDAELKLLLKDVCIPNSGVLPFIHPALLPERSNRIQSAVAGVPQSQEI